MPAPDVPIGVATRRDPAAPVLFPVVRPGARSRAGWWPPMAVAALAVAAGAGATHGQSGPVLEAMIESRVTTVASGVYAEPVVAVDPTDPDRMVTAAIELREPHSDAWQDRQTVVVFTTDDGGKSWTPRPVGGLPGTWVAGDPWLAWDGSRVHLAAIVAESLTRRGAVQFTGVFTSGDGGRTWRGPERPFPDSTMQDHPVIAVRGAAVVVAGSIADRTGDGVYVARTSGPTFEPADVRRVEPGRAQTNLGGAALLADGAVVVTYYTMRPPRRYAARRLDPTGAAGPEAVLAEDILPVGFPPVAASPGGDRVYTLWAEGPEPAITLRLAVSGDGGASWVPGATIEPAPRERPRTLPALAVSPSGAVAAVWQEFAAAGDCTFLHGAVSTDGGRSFGPPTRLSRQASCFGTEANGAAAYRFRLGGGDYLGLAPSGPDAFQVVWADSRDGTFQIFTARLEVRASRPPPPSP